MSATTRQPSREQTRSFGGVSLGSSLRSYTGLNRASYSSVGNQGKGAALDEERGRRRDEHDRGDRPGLVEVLQRRVTRKQERNSAFESAPGDECAVWGCEIAADQADGGDERANEEDGHDHQGDAVADVIEANERGERGSEGRKEQGLGDRRESFRDHVLVAVLACPGVRDKSPAM